ncbi:phospholipid trafficking lipoprotein MlaA [Cyanobacterium sp. HL-69]|uniref:hypothetical protein n=1 Tax=Cyanobacterium sp. HL-69 TaxID=2054282 RepID=UPI000CA31985|nr:phospholipid trafficking lipoprotein MlaA [Cyanobacterium sp. HL-69]
MKKTILILSTLSFFLVGCDRAALDGLNLKINADIRSDYDEQTQTIENSSDNNNSANSPSNTNTSTNSNPPTSNNTNAVDNSDSPRSLSPIAQCSSSDITMRANQEFYSSRGQVKSIDSKNEEEMKAWKEIRANIEAECQSN